MYATVPVWHSINLSIPKKRLTLSLDAFQKWPCCNKLDSTCAIYWNCGPISHLLDIVVQQGARDHSASTTEPGAKLVYFLH